MYQPKVNKLRIIISTVFLTVLALTSTTAQKSILDVMSYKEVLSVTIEADFAALDSARRTAEKHKAVLTFEDETGTEQQWNIKLSNRGNFRRLRCEMAPLKMDFKKKDLKAAGLTKFDDMKLVTHCVANKGEAKSLLQREYLAYKLYNEITEYSYRVQLLKINYIDAITGKKTKHWGFLIEDTAALIQRIGATEKVENHLNLPRDTFHDGLLKIASVFQYMIGNSDWDIQVGRNVKYLIKDGKVLVILYDFDFSGIVNASYAIPNPNFGLPNVKSRIFLGYHEDIDKLKSTLSFFKTKRLSLLEKVEEFRILDESSREEIIYYLDSFYQTFNEITLPVKVTPLTESTTVVNETK